MISFHHFLFNINEMTPKKVIKAKLKNALFWEELSAHHV